MARAPSSVETERALWSARLRGAAERKRQARARRASIGVLGLSAWATAELLCRRAAPSAGSGTGASSRLKDQATLALAHVAAWSLGWSWATAMWAAEERSEASSSR